MMERKTFEIRNKLGLHARPAAKLVNASTQYESKIIFERNGDQADGKSLLSVLTLACPEGSKLTILADGKDAREAIEALGKIIEDRFGEE